MTYTKTNWLDRSVQYPQRFTRTSDGTYDTLIPSPGTVTQAGTPITAEKLNNLETQYDQVMANFGAIFGYKDGQSFNGGFLVLPIDGYVQEINNNLYTLNGTGRIYFKKAGVYRVNLSMERSDLPANQHWAIGFAVNDNQAKMWTKNMVMGQYGWNQSGTPNLSKVPLSFSHMVRVAANDYINFNNNSDDGPRSYFDIMFSVDRVSD